MIELTLPTMTCGHCVAAVTQALKQADPQAQVEVDLARHLVRVQSVQDTKTLTSALADAGFETA